MKKALRIILIVIAIALVSTLVVRLIYKVNQKQIAVKTTKTLPDFKFKTLDNQDYSTSMLGPNKSVIFLYFNTECDHCQYEARELPRHIHEFANSTILMISAESMDKIKEFDATYQLSKNSFIKVLKDNDDTFYKIFSTKMTPSMFIYNQKGELVKQYQGEVKMDAIYKYL